MALFTIWEVIDIIVMTAFVGFIFKDAFQIPHREDPILAVKNQRKDAFIFAALVTAPAIILHEFGHKFVAMSFGMHATFQAAYMWLLIGLVLKLMNFGFIFFVPAFTSIMGSASPLGFAIVAFAGPAVNLVLWLSALVLEKHVKKKHRPFVMLTGRVNMFLFIFNMLPIPMFDGWSVYSGLFKTFF